jgi:ligand-binding SRPBCC domain-containing protein
MSVLDVISDRSAALRPPVRTLSRRQWLPLSQEATFAFFERPENLAAITPAWLGLRLLTPPPIVMAVGLTLDYRVRVLGLPGRWRSLITQYDPPHAFRDEQVRGPYRSWVHHHRFLPARGGTLIEDFVLYEPPLGLLGALMDRLTIRRQLGEIFDYRRQRLERLLLGGGRPS